jgi:hypothetical protein
MPAPIDPTSGRRGPGSGCRRRAEIAVRQGTTLDRIRLRRRHRHPDDAGRDPPRRGWLSLSPSPPRPLLRQARPRPGARGGSTPGRLPALARGDGWRIWQDSAPWPRLSRNPEDRSERDGDLEVRKRAQDRGEHPAVRGAVWASWRAKSSSRQCPPPNCCGHVGAGFPAKQNVDFGSTPGRSGHTSTGRLSAGGRLCRRARAGRPRRSASVRSTTSEQPSGSR